MKIVPVEPSEYTYFAENVSIVNGELRAFRYEAEDGTQFIHKKDCRQYEKRLIRKMKMKHIPQKSTKEPAFLHDYGSRKLSNWYYLRNRDDITLLSEEILYLATRDGFVVEEDTHEIFVNGMKAPRMNPLIFIQERLRKGTWVRWTVSSDIGPTRVNFQPRNTVVNVLELQFMLSTLDEMTQDLLDVNDSTEDLLRAYD